tara:strand:+ start:1624 stop:2469 length:846 start_codon:yes stop_codon:yes gene_type:complete
MLDLLTESSPGRFSRDLDWLLGCPSLLDSALTIETDGPAAVSDFGSVESFLQSKASYRVGYYVESLIEAWLNGLEGVGQVEHALQIKASKRTLGELDFLYRLNGVINHLEVALKFYFYHPQENGLGSHFVGPNASDSFERKRDKMLRQQIPLGREFHPEIDISQVMMKGLIFYPPGTDRPDDLPEGLNPDHRRGFWIRESFCDWLCAENGFSCGMVMEKPYWLSGVHSGSGAAVQSIDALRADVFEHFGQKRHPICVSVGDASGRETGRVFIVSDAWPDSD